MYDLTVFLKASCDVMESLFKLGLKLLDPTGIWEEGYASVAERERREQGDGSLESVWVYVDNGVGWEREQAEKG